MMKFSTVNHLLGCMLFFTTTTSIFSSNNGKLAMTEAFSLQPTVLNPHSLNSQQHNKHLFRDVVFSPSTTSSTLQKENTIYSTTTSLRMTSQTSTNTKKSENQSINWSLVGQSAANQALLGATIWTGGAQYHVYESSTHWTSMAAILGVLGVIPLIAISRIIEESESYYVSGLNLSTNAAVLRLFGPRKQPIAVFAIAAGLAGLTGVAEEVTFRGQLIPKLAESFGGGDIVTGALLSTLLFAILHTNPLSFFQGSKDQVVDSTTLLFLQCVNGGIFATLFFLSDYNLAVPITAHALYDFYIFYKTHMVDVAGQMEYVQQQTKTKKPIATNNKKEKENDDMMMMMLPQVQNKRLEKQYVKDRGESFVDGLKKTFYLMDTNRDGLLSRKELRIALYSYGINLSPEQSAKVAQSADSDGNGAIDLDEFLAFVGPNGSTAKAVRYTLFGPL